MAGYVKDLALKQLCHPPMGIDDLIQYEVLMGSVAYGVSSDTSDMDVYGFCIPPKDVIFPHLAGEIMGFGRQKQRFEVWQEHHVVDKSAMGGAGRMYDMSIYNIVKYFHLCMENNPNMIDSLFVPSNCVLYMTPVGSMVREARHLFLHKGSWHKFKGYAFSQVHKMKIKNPEGKRKELVDKYGFDVKFAYHVVRLMLEVEQILIEGDIDLQRNREQLKAIRRGEWTLEQVEQYFADKEKSLEDLYIKSTLPHSPDEAKIKELLLNCLEQHFGSLSGAVIREDAAVRALRSIEEIVRKVRTETQI